MSSSPNHESLLSHLERLNAALDVQADSSFIQALLENQALKEQLATQTHLMHLLTHQLATPLTSLSGSVHLLAEPLLEPEQRQEFLNVMQQQIQRLQTLLENLMALQNVETGALETHKTNFCLNHLLKEVGEAFNAYPIVYHLKPELPQVCGDRWQISQVLVNLLSNAIKYSPSSSPVEVGAAPIQPGWVEVWVQDYGLGIPIADQPRLFERFYRVQHHDRQGIQGNGLGLSLCKLLVENHGGTLSFESTHGEGSRFYFTLPSGGEEGDEEEL